MYANEVREKPKVYVQFPWFAQSPSCNDFPVIFRSEFKSDTITLWSARLSKRLRKTSSRKLNGFFVKVLETTRRQHRRLQLSIFLFFLTISRRNDSKKNLVSVKGLTDAEFVFIAKASRGTETSFKLFVE